MSDELFQNDAELAILNILMKNPEHVFDVKYIKEFMFGSTANQLLFKTIVDFSKEGLVPEINLIYSYLRDKNKEMDVGGKDYLNYIFNLDYSPENLEKFETLLANSYKARSLVTLGSNLSKSALSGKDVNVTLEEARKNLDNLITNTSSDETVNFESVLRSAYEDIKYKIENPGIPGVSTGIKGVDTATSGFNPGDLIIISGRPGMGKSTCVTNFASRISKLGVGVLIFSLEMNKVSLAERIISSETEIPFTNIRYGLLTQDQLDKITTKIRDVKSYPLYIDTKFGADLNYIVTTIRKYVKLFNVKVVFLDYIQLLSQRDEDATHEIGRISRTLKLLAGELGISIIILSQLNRGVESRDGDKRPTISDLRQSGNLEEDADIIVGLYRDEMYNKDTKDKGILEFIISKNRNGAIGLVKLDFKPEFNKIGDRY